MTFRNDKFLFKCIVLMLIALAVLSTQGCANSAEWTRADTAWELVYIATVAADAHMTSQIQDHPNIIEDGMIASHVLSSNPSTSSTWLYLGTSAVFHYGVARLLPDGWRRLWQGGAIIRHSMAVQNGYDLGLFDEPCTVNACDQ